jgi:acyl-CoA synthetase (AMP-forming)/AMP-acid ligase II
MLAEQAQLLPEKVALVTDGQRYTFGWLNIRANRCAQTLHSVSLKRGERVLIALDNSVELIVGLFATSQVGGTYVVVNPTTPAARLGVIFADCQPTVIIAGGRIAASIITACNTAGISPEMWWVGKVLLPPTIDAIGSDFNQILDGQPESPLQSPATADDVASIIYTSGTTGDPKGVMVAHRHIWAAAISIAAYLENTAEDVVLCVLPLFFSYGLCQLYVNFLTGGTLVLEKNFTFPAKTIQLLQQEKVTGFAAVPTIYNMLLQQEGLAKLDLSSLRYLTNAGAGMPPTLFRRVRETFPQAKLYLMYGQTECARIAYTPPALSAQYLEAVAFPVPNLEAWLEDEEGVRQPSTNSHGELVVKSPFVAYGYWNNPIGSASKFTPAENGEAILHTGDIFRTDENGYFYFVSRQDDIIKSRGEKVPPRLIENLLLELPQVYEVAVIGRPDEILGEAIALYLVLHEGAVITEQEVRAYCSKNLENFMWPKYIEFVETLPKTPSGKIAKADLKKQVLAVV